MEKRVFPRTYGHQIRILHCTRLLHNAQLHWKNLVHHHRNNIYVIYYSVIIYYSFGQLIIYLILKNQANKLY